METKMRVIECGYNIIEGGGLCVDRPYGRDDYLLIIFLARMEVTIHDTAAIVEPNSIVLFTPGCKHRIKGLGTFINSFVHFTGNSVPELISYLRVPVNTILRLQHYDWLNDLFKRIETQHILKEIYWENELEVILSEALISLARNLHHETTSVNAYEDIRIQFQKARVTIHRNLEKQWTIQSMADMTGFGKTRFYQYYIMFFRISPKNDLINARLDHARHLLTNHNTTIKQIAATCGFENICHFTRLFKKKFHTSPSHYYQHS